MLDVSTRGNRRHDATRNRWSVHKSGFWRPSPRLVLEQGFDYPELDLFLDQVIVVAAGAGISVYRMWFQDFSRASIIAELEQGGFMVENVWNDLEGTLFSEPNEWIGVVARRP